MFRKARTLKPLSHLIGECHINFEKLLVNILSISNVDDNKDTVFNVPLMQPFEEKLWFCGHQIGTIKGMIRMEKMPFLSQMKIGVLDNHGVHYSAKAFSLDNK